MVMFIEFAAGRAQVSRLRFNLNALRYAAAQEVAVMQLITVLTLLLLQQSPSLPDFSGTWKMDAARSQSPQQSTPVTDMTFVIEQRGDQIRLDMTTGSDKTVSVTYPIIDKPAAAGPPLVGDERRAYWDNNRLIAERGGTISGQTVSSRQSLTLSPDRSEMTVERIVIVQHGYTLRGAKNYATVKDVFTRVAP
jgi:hypothetical protein